MDFPNESNKEIMSKSTKNNFEPKTSQINNNSLRCREVAVNTETKSTEKRQKNNQ